MEAWAKSIPHVQFVCVCVESKQVGMAFHHMFQFENVINGYIPSRGYMPVGYGQLGCSGFIVSDKDGCFVSRKTKAYLDYGEGAFRHVEQLLEELVPTPTLPEPEPEVAEISKENEVKKDVKKKMRMDPPASVNVDSMDDEHKECTDSFNNVMNDPTFDNFQKLYNILKSHFDHEEELIAEYYSEKTNHHNDPSSSSAPSSSSSMSSSFSALTSHKMDHQRMLNMAQTELQRVNAANGNGNGNCGENK